VIPDYSAEFYALKTAEIQDKNCGGFKCTNTERTSNIIYSALKEKVRLILTSQFLTGLIPLTFPVATSLSIRDKQR